jgi:hypothetical protein
MSTKYRTINNIITKLIEQQKSQNTTINNTRDKYVHIFAKRTVNLTDVAFTNDEMQLLDKGLKYNLHHKPKNWILTLAMQTEVGIRQLPKKDQAYFRQIAANNLKKLINIKYKLKQTEVMRAIKTYANGKS